MLQEKELAKNSGTKDMGHSITAQVKMESGPPVTSLYLGSILYS